MNATIEISEATMQRLTEEAERRGTTVSDLVEIGLRHVLDECDKSQMDNDSLPPLPTRLSGGFLIDISNRDELYRIWDEESGLY